MNNIRRNEVYKCEELLKENLSPSEKYAIKQYLNSIRWKGEIKNVNRKIKQSYDMVICPDTCKYSFDYNINSKNIIEIN